MFRNNRDFLFRLDDSYFDDWLICECLREGSQENSGPLGIFLNATQFMDDKGNKDQNISHAIYITFYHFHKRERDNRRDARGGWVVDDRSCNRCDFFVGVTNPRSGSRVYGNSEVLEMVLNVRKRLYFPAESSGRAGIFIACTNNRFSSLVTSKR